MKTVFLIVPVVLLGYVLMIYFTRQPKKPTDYSYTNAEAQNVLLRCFDALALLPRDAKLKIKNRNQVFEKSNQPKTDLKNSIVYVVHSNPIEKFFSFKITSRQQRVFFAYQKDK